MRPADDGSIRPMSTAATNTADELRVRRGRKEVLHGLSLQVPRGALVGLLGPSGSGKIDPHALRSSGCSASPRARRRCWAARQAAFAARPRRLRDPGRERLRRPHGAPESQLFSGDPRRAKVRRRSSHRRGRPARARRLFGRLALRRRARAGLPGRGAAGLARTARARRADRRPRPRAAFGPVGALPPARRRGNDLLVSSHVMDEATRCDRLLLLRDGSLLADLTPAELLQSTGETDPEQAFLALIRRSATGEPVLGRTAHHEPVAHPRHRGSGSPADSARPTHHRAAARGAEPAHRADGLALHRYAGLRQRSGRRCSPCSRSSSCSS